MSNSIENIRVNNEEFKKQVNNEEYKNEVNNEEYKNEVNNIVKKVEERVDKTFTHSEYHYTHSLK